MRKGSSSSSGSSSTCGAEAEAAHTDGTQQQQEEDERELVAAAGDGTEQGHFSALSSSACDSWAMRCSRSERKISNPLQ